MTDPADPDVTTQDVPIGADPDKVKVRTTVQPEVIPDPFEWRPVHYIIVTAIIAVACVIAIIALTTMSARINADDERGRVDRVRSCAEAEAQITCIEAAG